MTSTRIKVIKQLLHQRALVKKENFALDKQNGKGSLRKIRFSSILKSRRHPNKMAVRGLGN